MTEFKINGIDWEMHLVESGEIEGCGETDYCTYRILILKNLKRSQMKSTIIHEVTHAFRWTYGNISQLDLLNIPSSEVEEYIANTVEVYGEKILQLSSVLLEKAREELNNEKL